MKKLLSYWGDIAFAPFYLVLLFVPFSYDDTFAFALRIFSVVFLVAAIILLIWNPMKKQRALRDWTYLIYGVFAALYLLGAYWIIRTFGAPLDMNYPLSGPIIADEFFALFTRDAFMLLRFFVQMFTVLRVGIWSYKLFQRRKAKKAPSEEA